MDPNLQLEPVTPEMEAPQKKTSKMLIYGAIAVISLSSVVVAAVLIFSSPKKDDSKIIKQAPNNEVQTFSNENETSDEVSAETVGSLDDQELDKEMQSLDQGIEKIGNDTTNVDKGLNEQQANLQ